MDPLSPPAAVHEGSPSQQHQLVLRSDRNVIPVEEAQQLDLRDHLSPQFITEKRFLSSTPAQIYRPGAFASQFLSEQQIVPFHQPHSANAASNSCLRSVEPQYRSSPHEGPSTVQVAQKVGVSGIASEEQRLISPHEEDASRSHLLQKADSSGSDSEVDYLTGSSDSNFPERKWSPAAAATASHDQDPRPASAIHWIAKPLDEKQPFIQNAHPPQHRRRTQAFVHHSAQRDEAENIREQSPAPKIEQKTEKKPEDLHPLERLEKSIAHRMTLKLWVEEERLLRSRTNDQVNFCRSTEKDIYLILALNFAFQALTVAGAAQASTLDCTSSWAPLIMSLIVSIAAFLATLQKLEARERHLSQLRAYGADTRVVIQYVDKLRCMGDMFDLMDLPQLTAAPLSKARSSSFPRKLLCGFAVFVLLILSLFSVITFVSFRAILCHH